METSAELGIVHVGRPSITRGRFSVAGCGQNLRVGHCLVVVGTHIGIEIRKLNIFALGNCVDIDDVSRFAVADFDSYRIREHEVRQPFARLDRDLGGNPAAERYAYHDNLA